MKTILLTGFLLFLSSAVFAHHTEHHNNQSDENDVIQTLEAFHQAILDYDTEKAKQLLGDDVGILESGNIESKEEYLSHHFHADGEFLRAMQQEVENRTVTVEGNTARVSTKTRVWGTFRDRELDLNSLELVVLTKNDSDWGISSLHWSSAGR